MWLSEQCGKPAPIDMAGVHKAVEGGFGKGNGIALEVSLHEGRTMCEDYRESDEKDVENRKATIFVGIRRTQNAADVITLEKIFHFLEPLIFNVVGLYNTVL